MQALPMQALPQTIHLEMDEQKTKQLKAMLGICQRLGAETRYHPEHRYFTAMVWTGWDTPCGMGEALAVQQKIQRIAAQYPAVVCYCFDPFSTLVYAAFMQTEPVDPDDVYQSLAVRLIRAVNSYDPRKGYLKEYILSQLKREMVRIRSTQTVYGLTQAPADIGSTIVPLTIAAQRESYWETYIAV